MQLLVYGKVQGVGYRYWASQRATTLGLNGFVRNRLDGVVELVISGEDKEVETMLRDCHRGPSLAKVNDIIVYDIEEDYSPRGFSIAKTV